MCRPSAGGGRHLGMKRVTYLLLRKHVQCSFTFRSAAKVRQSHILAMGGLYWDVVEEFLARAKIRGVVLPLNLGSQDVAQEWKNHLTGKVCQV
ncbi:MAG: hypothetical protein FH756_20170 [Firmicutes bacterium]|nr:hypothetical protein [Bacillota bacterium]